jgi:hypothetical protein
VAERKPVILHGGKLFQLPDGDTLPGATARADFDGYLDAAQNGTGFFDHSTSRLAFDAATGSVTLDGAGGADIPTWENGRRIDIAPHHELTFATPGDRYVYFPSPTWLDPAPALAEIKRPPHLNFRIVAFAYYNPDSPLPFVYAGEERHSTRRNPEAHLQWHLDNGMSWRGGGQLDFTLGEDVSAGEPFSISGTIRVADEDLRFTIQHSAASAGDDFTQSLAPLIAPTLYIGANGYYYASTPAAALPAVYNPIDPDSGAGTLTPPGMGEFVNYWLTFTTCRAFPVKWLIGRAAHASLEAAQGEAFLGMDLPLPEIVAAYQLICEQTASGLALRAAFRPTKDTVSGMSLGTDDHASLGGRAKANAHPASAIADLTRNQSVADSLDAAFEKMENLPTTDKWTTHLLHFDGDNLDALRATWAQTGALDYTQEGRFGKCVTTNGVAASKLFTPAIALNSRDFTVEAWVNLPAQPLVNSNSVFPLWLCSPGNHWGSLVCGIFLSRPDAPDAVTFWLHNRSATAPMLKGATDLRGIGWTHLALTRAANLWTLWVNGAAEASDAFAIDLAWTAGWQHYLLAGMLGATYSGFHGQLDEFRLSVGIARYTENFTPPAEPFGKFSLPWGTLDGPIAAQGDLVDYIAARVGGAAPNPEEWVSGDAGNALCTGADGLLYSPPPFEALEARRTFWTEQVRANATGTWLRIEGSFAGFETEYENLLAAQPQLVASADGGAIFVPMTAANLPSPQIVTESTTMSPSGNPGWKAFDDDPDTSWRSEGGRYAADSLGATGGEWVQIDLGSNPVACVACSAIPVDWAHAPKDFALLASNVDNNWAAATSLLSVEGVTDANEIHAFPNTTAWRYLRLVVTRLQGTSSTSVYLAEIGLFASGKTLVNTTDNAGTVLYVKAP